MTFCHLKGTTEPRICCIQRRGRETALSGFTFKPPPDHTPGPTGE